MDHEKVDLRSIDERGENGGDCAAAFSWRIEVLHRGEGWKALIYRPSSHLHEEPVPTGSDCRAVMQEVKMLVDRSLAP